MTHSTMHDVVLATVDVPNELRTCRANWQLVITR